MVTRNGEHWGYKNVRKEDWFYEVNFFFRSSEILSHNIIKLVLQKTIRSEMFYSILLKIFIWYDFG